MFAGDGYNGYDPRNPFPHDGEGKEPCTGLGCDCDEKTNIRKFLVLRLSHDGNQLQKAGILGMYL